MDAITERALGVLTSSKLLDALDLSKESEKVRDRYGDGKPYKFQYDGAPTVNDQLLMARRLVEAGVRVRHAVLRPLGQPRQELRPGARPRRQARQGLQRLDRRPGSPRHAQRRVGGRLGRVRPHAAHQQGRRPRPLAAGELRPAGGRRHEDRPGRSARPTASANTPRIGR